jgi:hypothetical protein
MAHVKDKNSPFNHAKGAPNRFGHRGGHGLVVGGWPAMVRDGWGAQKSSRTASCERHNTVSSTALKGEPIGVSHVLPFVCHWADRRSGSDPLFFFFFRTATCCNGLYHAHCGLAHYERQKQSLQPCKGHPSSFTPRTKKKGEKKEKKENSSPRGGAWVGCRRMAHDGAAMVGARKNHRWMAS